MGDGQKVSLRLQTSTFSKRTAHRFFKNHGSDKKPVQFGSSISYSKQFLNNFVTQSRQRKKFQHTNFICWVG
jgi:outer membrane protein insertion porin family